MFARKILLVLFLIPLFSACNMKSPELDQKTWKTFETDEYSIRYPKTWALNQSGYMGTSFLLISRQTSSRDFYQEYVGMVEESITNDSISLVQYVNSDILKLTDSLEYFNVDKNIIVQTDSSDYCKLVFAAVDGKYKVIGEKYYFQNNQKAYVLTFSAKALEIEHYQPIGEGILNSFCLK